MSILFPFFYFFIFSYLTFDSLYSTKIHFTIFSVCLIARHAGIFGVPIYLPSDAIFLDKSYPESLKNGNSFGAKKKKNSHMHAGRLPTIKGLLLFLVRREAFGKLFLAIQSISVTNLRATLHKQLT